MVETKIFVTSDLHIGHDKDFIYKARGFSSVEEMNEAILENWNRVVSENDDVYVLGDLVMANAEEGLEIIKRLNGRLHIILGNHDTDKKEELYIKLPNVVETCLAKRLKYKKKSIFMCHYPVLTGNVPNTQTYCMCGHIHTKDRFHDMQRRSDGVINPIYHVEMDAHNCTPILLESAVKEIKEYLSSTSIPTV